MLSPPDSPVPRPCLGHDTGPFGSAEHDDRSIRGIERGGCIRSSIWNAGVAPVVDCDRRRGIASCGHDHQCRPPCAHAYQTAHRKECNLHRRAWLLGLEGSGYFQSQRQNPPRPSTRPTSLFLTRRSMRFGFPLARVSMSSTRRAVRNSTEASERRRGITRKGSARDCRIRDPGSSSALSTARISQFGPCCP